MFPASKMLAGSRLVYNLIVGERKTAYQRQCLARDVRNGAGLSETAPGEKATKFLRRAGLDAKKV